MSAPVVEVLGEHWELPDPALKALWARCLSRGEPGRRLVHAGTSYDWTAAVTMQSIEARAGDWLMLHAAGVSGADGAVAALVAASGTGKSTAARTLCRGDFGYVTDETVAVRADHSVVPFPKPIAVIPAPGAGKVELGPDALGLRHCPERLRLGGLILLERRADAAGAVVELLDLLDGMVAVAPHISALPQLPGALARFAAAVEEAGGVHRVTYREAAQLPEIVHQVLAAAPVCSGFRHHPARTAAARPGIVRSQHRDAIELDGEVLVLDGSTCVLLQGIGSLVWLAADEPRTVEQIHDVVVAAAGEHPDAERLVRRAVSDLMELGVLVAG
ncbi:MAG: hypothetical protein Q4F67_06605 [Propionibacteriaceae bacterium]|nr:hypothetical protein [Propionibacteriaceae bacterium]